MVSFILSTSFSVTEIPLRRDSVPITTSLFSVFIHQNTKSTTGLNIYNIFLGTSQGTPKMLLIDVDRLTLLRRPQEVSFFKMHIF